MFGMCHRGQPVYDCPQAGLDTAAACAHCPIPIHRILDCFPLPFSRRVYLILQESHNGSSHIFYRRGPKKPRSSPPIFGSLGAPEKMAMLESLSNSLELRMSHFLVYCFPMWYSFIQGKRK
jgi:hypothetical protein